LVLAVLLAVAYAQGGMELRMAKSADADLDPLEIRDSDATNAMRMSGMPDDDMHEEQAEMMTSANEDAMEAGGHGEAMQLSGSSLKNVEADDADVDEDEAVSTDMTEDGATNAVFSQKAAELAHSREQMANSQETANQQMRDAKRLIKEAYSKQAFLNTLQKQVLEQNAAVDAQKHQLKAKEAEIELMRSELERKMAEATREAGSAQSRMSVSAAIQTQMKDLDGKKKDVEKTEADQSAQLHKTKASLEKMKADIEAKDRDVTKKETDRKKLFVELNALKKSSDQHENELRKHEELVKKQQADLAAREAELAAHEASLKDKEAALKSEEAALAHTHHAPTHAEIERMVESQNAIQTDLSVTKDLSELPPVAKHLVEKDDLTWETQFAKQPDPPVAAKPHLVVSQPPAALSIKQEEPTSRSIESRMDERPSTYGEKLLAGQAYSAAFNPASGDRDPDGKCRNSRGDLIPCTAYAVDKSLLPNIVPTLSDLGEEYDTWAGPCVLKCAYHKGPTSAAGPKNIEEISIEIQTGLTNHTYGCPRSNNGYPFLSCSLMVDGSDACRSTCVFDGDANPLKPKMFGLGAPLNQPMNMTAFRSLAHSTYSVETDKGCKSSMKADPLVSCEVRL